MEQDIFLNEIVRINKLLENNFFEYDKQFYEIIPKLRLYLKKEFIKNRSLHSATCSEFWMVLHKSTRNKGFYQITYFDKLTPIRHRTFLNLNEAIKAFAYDFHPEYNNADCKNYF